MPYLADDLITSIKRDAFFPTTQGNFTDAKLMAIADEVLLFKVVPKVKAWDENFYLDTVDIPFVADQDEYTLPRYAMGNALKDVKTVDANGQVKALTRITDVARLADYDTANSGQPGHFYLEHTTIRVVPAPSTATDSLRLWIWRRPGRMVPASSARTVSSLVKATGVLTYATAKPATFTSSSAHDVYSHVSPFRRVAASLFATASAATTTHTFAGPRTLAYDGATGAFTVGLTATGGTSGATGKIEAVTSTTLTLSAVSGTFQDNEALTDTNSGVAVVNGTLSSAITDARSIAPGNYVCVVDETVYVDCPIEFAPLLQLYVRESLAVTAADAKALELIQGQIREALQNIALLAGNRVQAQPKQIRIPRLGMGRRALPSVAD